MGVNCRTLLYSRHAFERMFQRAIPPEVVEQVTQYMLWWHGTRLQGIAR
jgi:hypothetical protein